MKDDYAYLSELYARSSLIGNRLGPMMLRGRNARVCSYCGRDETVALTCPGCGAETAHGMKMNPLVAEDLEEFQRIDRKIQRVRERMRPVSMWEQAKAVLAAFL